jgi:DNA-binding beta-propeller fold protein YncE
MRSAPHPPVRRGIILLAASLAAGCASAPAKIDFAQYVWPPPPDPPRIQLEDVVWGRADTLAKSRFQRALLGSSPQGPYDWLKRPFAVAWDAQGRLLVTDSGLGALFRFDRAARKADVLGTAGAVALRTPLGLDVGRDGRIYVADAGIRKVVAFDPDGKVRAVYGREGELENPTDAAVSPDGRSLYVADSKAHRITVFDIRTARQLRNIGRRGQGEGEFNFPSSVAFDSSGNLLVVDQINARVQVLTDEGRYLDQFGGLGVGYANFVRPKDVAADEAGFVYVTDAAFGNVQIFDADLRLLTYVGSSGENPGQFQIASGVAVRGDHFAIVDQLGRRVQVFRYIVPKTASLDAPAAPRAAVAPPAPAKPASTKPDPAPPAPAPGPLPVPAAPPPRSAELPEPKTPPPPVLAVPPVAPRPTSVSPAQADGRALLRQGSFAEAAQAFVTSLAPEARGRFSHQLLVACAPETITKAVKAVAAEELFILPITFQGRSCYRLCWGVYDNRAAAEAARGGVPAYFRQGGVSPRLSPLVNLLP